MSDKTTTSHDNPAHKKDTDKPADASRVLFDDLNSGMTIAKFNKDGEISACKTNAPEGTVPTLISGKTTQGCEYKAAKDLPKDLRHLDFANIYNQAAESTVRIDATLRPPGDKNKNHKVDGPIGSGAIIGKDVKNGECLVLTANHVANGTKDLSVSNTRAVTADGKIYPSEIRFSDPKHDRAVLAIKTGADTEKTCKPFTPADNAKKEAADGKKLIALGFAEGSRALYASPGTSYGVHSALEVLGKKDLKKFGLDRQATAVVVDNQVRPGQSGGPVVTDKGKLIGINQLAMSETEGSMALPLDKAAVEALLSRARR